MGADLPFSPKEAGLGRVLGRNCSPTAAGLLLLFGIKILWFWLACADELAMINKIPEPLT